MNYEFIGWCKEGNHDKVWGAILLKKGDSDIIRNYSIQFEFNKYLTFWGRRGAKLQTKIVEGTGWTITDLANKKLKKGYVEIQPNKLDEVYPEFETDLEKTAIWATLKL